MTMSPYTQITFPSKTYPQSCSRLLAGLTYSYAQLKSSHNDSELPSHLHYPGLPFSIYTQLLLAFIVSGGANSNYCELPPQVIQVISQGTNFFFFLVLWILNHINFPHKPCYLQYTVLQNTGFFRIQASCSIETPVHVTLCRETYWYQTLVLFEFYD